MALAFFLEERVGLVPQDKEHFTKASLWSWSRSVHKCRALTLALR